MTADALGRRISILLGYRYPHLMAVPGRRPQLARGTGRGHGYGSVLHHDGCQRGIFAHTSPVYIAVGGAWWMINRDTSEYMLTLIDGCLSDVRHTAPQRADVQTTFHQASRATSPIWNRAPESLYKAAEGSAAGVIAR